MVGKAELTGGSTLQQEPTVIPPALLDLCSITIMHRFSSVGWFDHLCKHVSSDFGSEAFDSVVRLKVGRRRHSFPNSYGSNSPVFVYSRLVKVLSSRLVVSVYLTSPVPTRKSPSSM